MLLLFIVTLLLIACDSRLRTVSYTIDSPKIDSPVRIAVIADLHSCRYGQEQQQLIQAIADHQPDIICLVGDIYDPKLPAKNVENLLKGINSYPCYYVTGNHECHSEDLEEILALFASYNVNILQGDRLEFNVNGQELSICGLDDPIITRRHPEQPAYADQLAALTATDPNKTSPDNYAILLAHRPERISEYLIGGYDLILSGHAHGGQWRVPGLINGLYAPHQGLLPKYAGGRYDFPQRDDQEPAAIVQTMIVSRGLAKESTPLIPRIFNRPELVIIDLV